MRESSHWIVFFQLTSFSVHPSLYAKMVLSFILVQNRQGKTRLAKWYAPYTDEEKVKLKGEVSLHL